MSFPIANIGIVIIISIIIIIIKFLNNIILCIMKSFSLLNILFKDYDPPSYESENICY